MLYGADAVTPTSGIEARSLRRDVMATEVKITDKHSPDRVDSATGETCIAEKVVNITVDCSGLKKSQRIHLVFTRAQRGRIVQIVDGTTKEFCEERSHWFVDELEAEFHVSDANDTFGQWAGRLGMSKQALRKLIEAQAPAV